MRGLLGMCGKTTLKMRVFLDHFDELISKIIFKKLKKILF